MQTRTLPARRWPEATELLSWLSWPAALLILVGWLQTELLPVLLGTGWDAKWDWGFVYVTMRFILLPFLCVSHVIGNIAIAIFLLSKRDGENPWPALSSIAVSAGYLLALYLDPTFPARLYLRP